MQHIIHRSSGKIILSGEYAVVFGHPGIAIPAPCAVEVSYVPGGGSWEAVWEGTCGDRRKADAYCTQILSACEERVPMTPGRLRIRNHIPLGKGMGSSTALTIAIARCVVSGRIPDVDMRSVVRSIEDRVNPGNSGIDFTTIWEGRPVFFRKSQESRTMTFPKSIADLLATASLIDTGAPGETTPQLVSWVTMRHVQGDPAIEPAIHAIGECSRRMERLCSGEGDTQEFFAIIRDHHRAQVSLGIVTEKTQNLITKIEQEGGSAKVIGAGGRTGGSGMIIAFEQCKIYN